MSQLKYVQWKITIMGEANKPLEGDFKSRNTYLVPTIKFNTMTIQLTYMYNHDNNVRLQTSQCIAIPKAATDTLVYLALWKSVHTHDCMISYKTDKASCDLTRWVASLSCLWLLHQEHTTWIDGRSAVKRVVCNIMYHKDMIAPDVYVSQLLLYFRHEMSKVLLVDNLILISKVSFKIKLSTKRTFIINFHDLKLMQRHIHIVHVLELITIGTTIVSMLSITSFYLSHILCTHIDARYLQTHKYFLRQTVVPKLSILITFNLHVADAHLCTRNSTKQTCLSSVSIIHWRERKPLWSTRNDIFVDWLSALVHGFSKSSLYLHSWTSNKGPSEEGTSYVRPLYRGHCSRSQKLPFPIVFIHKESPRRGQPPCNRQNLYCPLVFFVRRFYCISVRQKKF